MGFETTIDAAQGIVELRCVGTARHEEHILVREELLRICREQGIRRVLIDATELVLRDEPTTLELFDFALGWVERAREMPLRLAAVYPRDAYTRAQVAFGDTVARNRGLGPEAFETREEARAWLQR